MAKHLNNIKGQLIENFSPANRKKAKFENQNPDAPWFATNSISYIEKILKPEFTVFEWGSGRSTIWFAQRVEKVISVEGNRDWFDNVNNELNEKNLNHKVELYFKEISTSYDYDPKEVEEYISVIKNFPDRSLDVVVVDGHCRHECLKACISKVRPGGYLILDNSDLPEFADFLSSLQLAEKKSFQDGVQETTILKVHPTQGLK